MNQVKVKREGNRIALIAGGLSTVLTLDEADKVAEGINELWRKITDENIKPTGIDAMNKTEVKRRLTVDPEKLLVLYDKPGARIWGKRIARGIRKSLLKPERNSFWELGKLLTRGSDEGFGASDTETRENIWLVFQKLGGSKRNADRMFDYL